MELAKRPKPPESSRGEKHLLSAHEQHTPAGQQQRERRYEHDLPESAGAPRRIRSTEFLRRMSSPQPEHRAQPPSSLQRQLAPSISGMATAEDGGPQAVCQSESSLARPQQPQPPERGAAGGPPPVRQSQTLLRKGQAVAAADRKQLLPQKPLRPSPQARSVFDVRAQPHGPPLPAAESVYALHALHDFDRDQRAQKGGFEPAAAGSALASVPELASSRANLRESLLQAESAAALEALREFERETAPPPDKAPPAAPPLQVSSANLRERLLQEEMAEALRARQESSEGRGGGGGGGPAVEAVDRGPDFRHVDLLESLKRAESLAAMQALQAFEEEARLAATESVERAESRAALQALQAFESEQRAHRIEEKRDFSSPVAGQDNLIESLRQAESVLALQALREFDDEQQAKSGAAAAAAAAAAADGSCQADGAVPPPQLPATSQADFAAGLGQAESAAALRAPQEFEPAGQGGERNQGPDVARPARRLSATRSNENAEGLRKASSLAASQALREFEEEQASGRKRARDRVSEQCPAAASPAANIRRAESLAALEALQEFEREQQALEGEPAASQAPGEFAQEQATGEKVRNHVSRQPSAATTAAAAAAAATEANLAENIRQAESLAALDALQEFDREQQARALREFEQKQAARERVRDQVSQQPAGAAAAATKANLAEGIRQAESLAALDALQEFEREQQQLAAPQAFREFEHEQATRERVLDQASQQPAGAAAAAATKANLAENIRQAESLAALDALQGFEREQQVLGEERAASRGLREFEQEQARREERVQDQASQQHAGAAAAAASKANLAENIRQAESLAALDALQEFEREQQVLGEERAASRGLREFEQEQATREERVQDQASQQPAGAAATKANLAENIRQAESLAALDALQEFEREQQALGEERAAAPPPQAVPEGPPPAVGRASPAEDGAGQTGGSGISEEAPEAPGREEQIVGTVKEEAPRSAQQQQQQAHVSGEPSAEQSLGEADAPNGVALPPADQPFERDQTADQATEGRRRDSRQAVDAAVAPPGEANAAEGARRAESVCALRESEREQRQAAGADQFEREQADEAAAGRRRRDSRPSAAASTADLAKSVRLTASDFAPRESEREQQPARDDRAGEPPPPAASRERLPESPGRAESIAALRALQEFEREQGTKKDEEEKEEGRVGESLEATQQEFDAEHGGNKAQAHDGPRRASPSGGAAHPDQDQAEVSAAAENQVLRLPAAGRADPGVEERQPELPRDVSERPPPPTAQEAAAGGGLEQSEGAAAEAGSASPKSDREQFASGASEQEEAAPPLPGPERTELGGSAGSILERLRQWEVLGTSRRASGVSDDDGADWLERPEPRVLPAEGEAFSNDTSPARFPFRHAEPAARPADADLGVSSAAEEPGTAAANRSAEERADANAPGGDLARTPRGNAGKTAEAAGGIGTADAAGGDLLVAAERAQAQERRPGAEADEDSGTVRLIHPPERTLYPAAAAAARPPRGAGAEAPESDGQQWCEDTLAMLRAMSTLDMDKLLATIGSAGLGASFEGLALSTQALAGAPGDVGSRRDLAGAGLGSAAPPAPVGPAAPGAEGGRAQNRPASAQSGSPATAASSRRLSAVEQTAEQSIVALPVTLAILKSVKATRPADLGTIKRIASNPFLRHVSQRVRAIPEVQRVAVAEQRAPSPAREHAASAEGGPPPDVRETAAESDRTERAVPPAVPEPRRAAAAAELRVPGTARERAAVPPSEEGSPDEAAPGVLEAAEGGRTGRMMPPPTAEAQRAAVAEQQVPSLARERAAASPAEGGSPDEAAPGVPEAAESGGAEQKTPRPETTPAEAASAQNTQPENQSAGANEPDCGAAAVDPPKFSETEGGGALSDLIDASAASDVVPKREEPSEETTTNIGSQASDTESPAEGEILDIKGDGSRSVPPASDRNTYAVPGTEQRRQTETTTGALQNFDLEQSSSDVYTRPPPLGDAGQIGRFKSAEFLRRLHEAKSLQGADDESKTEEGDVSQRKDEGESPQQIDLQRNELSQQHPAEPLSRIFHQAAVRSPHNSYDDFLPKDVTDQETPPSVASDFGGQAATYKSNEFLRKIRHAQRSLAELDDAGAGAAGVPETAENATAGSRDTAAGELSKVLVQFEAREKAAAASGGPESEGRTLARFDNYAAPPSDRKPNADEIGVHRGTAGAESNDLARQLREKQGIIGNTDFSEAQRQLIRCVLNDIFARLDEGNIAVREAITDIVQLRSNQFLQQAEDERPGPDHRAPAGAHQQMIRYIANDILHQLRERLLLGEGVDDGAGRVMEIVRHRSNEFLRQLAGDEPEAAPNAAEARQIMAGRIADDVISRVQQEQSRLPIPEAEVREIVRFRSNEHLRHVYDCEQRTLPEGAHPEKQQLIEDVSSNIIHCLRQSPCASHAEQERAVGSIVRHRSNELLNYLQSKQPAALPGPQQQSGPFAPAGGLDQQRRVTSARGFPALDAPHATGEKQVIRYSVSRDAQQQLVQSVVDDILVGVGDENLGTGVSDDTVKDVVRYRSNEFLRQLQGETPGISFSAAAEEHRQMIRYISNDINLLRESSPGGNARDKAEAVMDIIRYRSNEFLRGLSDAEPETEVEETPDPQQQMIRHIADDVLQAQASQSVTGEEINRIVRCRSNEFLRRVCDHVPKVPPAEAAAEERQMVQRVSNDVLRYLQQQPPGTNTAEQAEALGKIMRYRSNEFLSLLMGKQPADVLQRAADAGQNDDGQATPVCDTSEQVANLPDVRDAQQQLVRFVANDLLARLRDERRGATITREAVRDIVQYRANGYLQQLQRERWETDHPACAEAHQQMIQCISDEVIHQLHERPPGKHEADHIVDIVRYRSNEFLRCLSGQAVQAQNAADAQQQMISHIVEDITSHTQQAGPHGFSDAGVKEIVFYRSNEFLESVRAEELKVRKEAAQEQMVQRVSDNIHRYLQKRPPLSAAAEQEGALARIIRENAEECVPVTALPEPADPQQQMIRYIQNDVLRRLRQVVPVQDVPENTITDIVRYRSNEFLRQMHEISPQVPTAESARGQQIVQYVANDILQMFRRRSADTSEQADELGKIIRYRSNEFLQQLSGVDRSIAELPEALDPQQQLARRISNDVSQELNRQAVRACIPEKAVTEIVLHRSAEFFRWVRDTQPQVPPAAVDRAEQRMVRYVSNEILRRLHDAPHELVGSQAGVIGNIVRYSSNELLRQLRGDWSKEAASETGDPQRQLVQYISSDLRSLVRRPPSERAAQDEAVTEIVRYRSNDFLRKLADSQLDSYPPEVDEEQEIMVRHMSNDILSRLRDLPPEQVVSGETLGEIILHRSNEFLRHLHEKQFDAHGLDLDDTQQEMIRYVSNDILNQLRERATAGQDPVQVNEFGEFVRYKSNEFLRQMSDLSGIRSTETDPTRVQQIILHVLGEIIRQLSTQGSDEDASGYTGIVGELVSYSGNEDTDNSECFQQLIRYKSNQILHLLRQPEEIKPAFEANLVEQRPEDNLGQPSTAQPSTDLPGEARSGEFGKTPTEKLPPQEHRHERAKVAMLEKAESEAAHQPIEGAEQILIKPLAASITAEAEKNRIMDGGVFAPQTADRHHGPGGTAEDNSGRVKKERFQEEGGTAGKPERTDDSDAAAIVRARRQTRTPESAAGKGLHLTLSLPTSLPSHLDWLVEFKRDEFVRTIESVRQLTVVLQGVTPRAKIATVAANHAAADENTADAAPEGRLVRYISNTMLRRIREAQTALIVRSVPFDGAPSNPNAPLSAEGELDGKSTGSMEAIDVVAEDEPKIIELAAIGIANEIREYHMAAQNAADEVRRATALAETIRIEREKFERASAADSQQLVKYLSNPFLRRFKKKEFAAAKSSEDLKHARQITTVEALAKFEDLQRTSAAIAFERQKLAEAAAAVLRAEKEELESACPEAQSQQLIRYQSNEFLRAAETGTGEAFSRQQSFASSKDAVMEGVIRAASREQLGHADSIAAMQALEEYAREQSEKAEQRAVEALTAAGKLIAADESKVPELTNDEISALREEFQRAEASEALRELERQIIINHTHARRADVAAAFEGLGNYEQVRIESAALREAIRQAEHLNLHQKEITDPAQHHKEDLEIANVDIAETPQEHDKESSLSTFKSPSRGGALVRRSKTSHSETEAENWNALKFSDLPEELIESLIEFRCNEYFQMITRIREFAGIAQSQTAPIVEIDGDVSAASLEEAERGQLIRYVPNRLLHFIRETQATLERKSASQTAESAAPQSLLWLVAQPTTNEMTARDMLDDVLILVGNARLIAQHLSDVIQKQIAYQYAAAQKAGEQAKQANEAAEALRAEYKTVAQSAASEDSMRLVKYQSNLFLRHFRRREIAAANDAVEHERSQKSVVLQAIAGFENVERALAIKALEQQSQLRKAAAQLEKERNALDSSLADAAANGKSLIRYRSNNLLRELTAGAAGSGSREEDAGSVRASSSSLSGTAEPLAHAQSILALQALEAYEREHNDAALKRAQEALRHAESMAALEALDAFDREQLERQGLREALERANAVQAVTALEKEAQGRSVAMQRAESHSAFLALSERARDQVDAEALKSAIRKAEDDWALDREKDRPAEPELKAPDLRAARVESLLPAGPLAVPPETQPCDAKDSQRAGAAIVGGNMPPPAEYELTPPGPAPTAVPPAVDADTDGASGLAEDRNLAESLRRTEGMAVAKDSSVGENAAARKTAQELRKAESAADFEALREYEKEQNEITARGVAEALQKAENTLAFRALEEFNEEQSRAEADRRAEALVRVESMNALEALRAFDQEENKRRAAELQRVKSIRDLEALKAFEQDENERRAEAVRRIESIQAFEALKAFDQEENERRAAELQRIESIYALEALKAFEQDENERRTETLRRIESIRAFEALKAFDQEENERRAAELQRIESTYALEALKAFEQGENERRAETLRRIESIRAFEALKAFDQEENERRAAELQRIESTYALEAVKAFDQNENERRAEALRRIESIRALEAVKAFEQEENLKRVEALRRIMSISAVEAVKEFEQEEKQRRAEALRRIESVKALETVNTFEQEENEKRAEALRQIESIHALEALKAFDQEEDERRAAKLQRIESTRALEAGKAFEQDKSERCAELRRKESVRSLGKPSVVDQEENERHAEALRRAECVRAAETPRALEYGGNEKSAAEALRRAEEGSPPESKLERRGAAERQAALDSALQRAETAAELQALGAIGCDGEQRIAGEMADDLRRGESVSAFQALTEYEQEQEDLAAERAAAEKAEAARRAEEALKRAASRATLEARQNFERERQEAAEREALAEQLEGEENAAALQALKEFEREEEQRRATALAEGLARTDTVASLQALAQFEAEQDEFAARNAAAALKRAASEAAALALQDLLQKRPAPVPDVSAFEATALQESMTLRPTRALSETVSNLELPLSVPSLEADGMRISYNHFDEQQPGESDEEREPAERLVQESEVCDLDEDAYVMVPAEPQTASEEDFTLASLEDLVGPDLAQYEVQSPRVAMPLIPAELAQPARVEWGPTTPTPLLKESLASRPAGTVLTVPRPPSGLRPQSGRRMRVRPASASSSASSFDAAFRAADDAADVPSLESIVVRGRRKSRPTAANVARRRSHGGLSTESLASAGGGGAAVKPAVEAVRQIPPGPGKAPPLGPVVHPAPVEPRPEPLPAGGGRAAPPAGASGLPQIGAVHVSVAPPERRASRVSQSAEASGKAADADVLAIVRVLQNDVRKLQQELRSRDELLHELQEKEEQLKSDDPTYASKDAAHRAKRLALHAQKQAYQTVIGRLRKEIRWLKFKRYSPEESARQSKLLPYLPQAALPAAAAARNPARHEGESGAQCAEPIKIRTIPPVVDTDLEPNRRPLTARHGDGDGKVQFSRRGNSDSAPGETSAGADGSRHPTRGAPEPVGDRIWTSPLITTHPVRRNAGVAKKVQPGTEQPERPPLLPSPDTDSEVEKKLLQGVSEEDRPFKNRDRVLVMVGGKRVLGVVRYVGFFDLQPDGGVWIGVALDDSVGRHDGVILGKRYFTTLEGHGYFCKAEKAALMKKDFRLPKRPSSRSPSATRR